MSRDTALLSFSTHHVADRGVAEMLAGVRLYLAACWRRDRERHQLMSMGELLRHDIGDGRVLDELTKPFWRE